MRENKVTHKISLQVSKTILIKAEQINFNIKLIYKIQTFKVFSHNIIN